MPQQRRIALFVEGKTESGVSGQRTISAFLKNWLDPQLPANARVGIHPISFKGASNYLDDLASKVEDVLRSERANFVFGLLDLYGLPPSRFDFSQCFNVKDKVAAAKAKCESLVPEAYRGRFRQHFAVHETEAWLLAYPEEFPREVRKQIEDVRPEEVNFEVPPARFLKRILGGKYDKVRNARKIFPKVDPSKAINSLPYLGRFARNVLDVAKNLQ